MKKELREQVYNKFGGKCAYTGNQLKDDWQVDHMISKFEWDYFKYDGDVNNINNLTPALRIVNHYKRSLDLEQFRKYMLTFHLRLAKLPKKTSIDATKKRIIYMNTVADAFNITVDKPFNGEFYFEKDYCKINL